MTFFYSETMEKKFERLNLSWPLNYQLMTMVKPPSKSLYGAGRKKWIRSLVDELVLTKFRETHLFPDVWLDLSPPDNKGVQLSFLYRPVVGILLYKAIHTWPEIALVTSMLAQNVERPSMIQQAAIKTVKYLNTTSGNRIVSSHHHRRNWQLM